jgi:hypothetical protein
MRKERWSLSWRGWLLVTSAGLLAAYFAFLNIHPFLAVTHRVNTNILVVEGTIQRYAIRGGAEEFKKGWYERIFTTGRPGRRHRRLHQRLQHFGQRRGGELEIIWRSG